MLAAACSVQMQAKESSATCSYTRHDCTYQCPAGKPCTLSVARSGSSASVKGPNGKANPVVCVAGGGNLTWGAKDAKILVVAFMDSPFTDPAVILIGSSKDPVSGTASQVNADTCFVYSVADCSSVNSCGRSDPKVVVTGGTGLTAQ
jgi:hypothetical protein